MHIQATEMRDSSRPVEATFPQPAMEGLEGSREPIRITAQLAREGGGYRLAGHLTANVSLACALCTRVFSHAVATDFSLLYRPATASAAACAALPPDHELAPEECAVAELDEQGRIDLASLSREQIYLALPLKPNCRADCRGLCSQCGIDLNTTTCGCVLPEFNPPLAALAEIKNRF